MGKIRLLEDHIANQIAAGEVVERPSSVVKELIENAIDAEATKIEVHVEEGGLRSIRVKDNGTGMERDDALLAFSRHATSKIRTGKDLFKIATLGFRGEALPSIAAVSKVVCKTNMNESGLGTFIEIEGGIVKKNEEAVVMKGTEFTITDLFYNTPARLKYLKSVNTELSQIGDYIHRLALAHPHISFHFFHEGKTLLQTSGNSQLLHVIQSIYGTDVARSMVSLKGESLDFEIIGYMSKPEMTRANRNYMTIIVNGRAIKNITINQAILKGYHTLLPVHRYPVIVLHIKMDPSLLDVNVHPAKLEVRFSKEQLLADEISNVIESIWQKETLIPSYTPKVPSPKVQAPVQPSLFQVEDNNETHQANEQVEQRENEMTPLPQIKSKFASSIESKEQFISSSPIVKEGIKSYQQQTATGYTPSEKVVAKNEPIGTKIDRPVVIEETVATTTIQNPITDKETQVVTKEAVTNPVLSSGRRMPFIEPVGQVHGTYIIGQNETGMYMIDQHAAHERIYYERFMKKIGEEQRDLQHLLIPIMIELAPAELKIVDDRSDILQKVGIFYEQFGTSSIIVRSHPHWFPHGTEEELVRDMIDMVLEMKKELAISAIREKAAIMMSCKAAIKANQYLTKQEMIALFEQLNETTNPYTCPHGRPIIVNFSTYDLEKMFKRVM